MRFFGKIAIALVIMGVFSSALLAILGYVFGWDVNINTLVIVNLVTLIMGTQFIFLGLLGEIQMRAYFESQNKDPYYIREIINSGQISRKPPKEVPREQKVKYVG
jgi:hypothetical protein